MKILPLAIACFSLCILPRAAMAQETAASATQALSTAIEKAETHKQLRWAFTMTYREQGKEGEKAYKLRYDPRAAEDARWTLLSPALDSLDKKEKKFLKRMQKNDAADATLVYDGLEVDLAAVSVISETDSTAIFNVPLIDEDTPRKMREAVDMLVTVNKAGRYVETIELKANGPFKPAPVAKVESFNQTQHYAPIEPDGPVLLRTSTSSAKGSAMMKKFDTNSQSEYSDFELVEVEKPTEG